MAIVYDSYLAHNKKGYTPAVSTVMPACQPCSSMTALMLSKLDEFDTQAHLLSAQ
jgi:hypothetical protein